MSVFDWPVIDEDKINNREMEILMAKLQPYDGETVYGRAGNDRDTDFMGYELKRYRVVRSKQRSWAIGTSVIRHTKVNKVFDYQSSYTNYEHVYITPGLEDEQRDAEKDDRASRPGTREYEIMWGSRDKF